MQAAFLNKIVYALLVAGAVLVGLSANHCFFWDAIAQVSVPAHWYYQQGFSHFFLPDDIATGHPTFVGMYLAFCWQWLGKSVWVAHWAMLPFVWGTIWALWHWCNRLTNNLWQTCIITVCVLADATLLAQLSQVSFDVVQICMFCWCLYAYEKQQKWLQMIAFMALCMCSLRGVMSGAGLMLSQLILQYNRANKQAVFRNMWVYVPGIVAVVAFLVAFKLHKGWMIHNTVSNKWQESGEWASGKEMLRNAAIFVWRMIDFGRVGYALVTVLTVAWWVRQTSKTPQPLVKLMWLVLCQTVVFFPVLVVYRNAFGHRYLLPIIIPMIAAAVYWLCFVMQLQRSRIIALATVMVIGISGYAWVYPVHIAMGWDATPAHWPYYSLRKQMLTYIQRQQINVSAIGSSFPNNDRFSITDVNEDARSFAEVDVQQNEYILFSNVFNERDDVIEVVKDAHQWQPIYTVQKGGVVMCLYKKMKH